jgi:hypothetical protein
MLKRRLVVTIAGVVSAAPMVVAAHVLSSAVAGASVPAPVRSAIPPGRALGTPPVVAGGRAVWAEIGPRGITIAAADLDGRRERLFSSADAPGVPNGSEPFWGVSALAADAHHVAFIRNVGVATHYTCGQTLGGPLPPCVPPREPVKPVGSVSLVAGAPGHVRPVITRSVQTCKQAWDPSEVAVADSGLVVLEAPCGASRSRIVLRTFGGRLVRVLLHFDGAPPFTSGASLAGPVAAGRWIGWTTSSGNDRSTVTIIDGKTGRTIVHERVLGRGGLALSRDGTYGLGLLRLVGDTSKPGQFQYVTTILVGSVRRPTPRFVTHAATVPAIAAGRGRAAFITGGPDPSAYTIAVQRPGGTEARVLPTDPGGPLAFDGRILATTRDNTIELLDPFSAPAAD